jgi:hypothetical protein
MSRLPHRILPNASVAEAALSLETQALHAGSAWACQYSSSAEFDAALIAERRAAGVYGPKRQRRQMLIASAAVAAAVAVIVLAIQIIS